MGVLLKIIGISKIAYNYVLKSWRDYFFLRDFSTQQKSWYKNQSKVVGYKWNTIFDEQTCDGCSERDGMIISVEEAHIDQIELICSKDSLCRCYLTPIIK